jgi:diaminobutyrate-2-oxoglutarate transaminase
MTVSFERANIIPDIVTLSKSISGYGFPMSLLLFKAEHDQWKPAEHTGTFRGNQLAFVGATAAIDYFCKYSLADQVKEKGAYLQQFLHQEIAPLHEHLHIRGLGMIWGIDFALLKGAEFTKAVAKDCFDLGLIIECAGRNDTVLKLLPPLTIEYELLQQGCQIIKQAIIHSVPTKSSK